MTDPDRSDDRECAFLVRMSQDHHQRLKLAAAEAGVTMQVYCNAKLFDEPYRVLSSAARTKPGPKPRATQREELPMTG